MKLMILMKMMMNGNKQSWAISALGKKFYDLSIEEIIYGVASR